MRIELLDGVLVRASAPAPRALWLIHAFGESGLPFLPLFDGPLAQRYTLFTPDLPGFGASPPQPERATLRGLGELVAALVEHHTPEGAVGLVGHSLGAPIAVEAARRLGPRVRALLSVEGNLTQDDAYFSGRAAEYDDPGTFKRELCESIWQTAGESRGLRGYFASLAFADPETLWRLGRDTHAASVGDALGAAYLALTCPTLYYWCEATTPRATQRYLRERGVPERRHNGGTHWPMVERPEETAEALMAFFGPRLVD